MESWIIVAALLAVALVIGYANFQNAKPFRIESSTSLDPAATLDALQSRMARDGWALGYRDDSRLIMSTGRRADLDTAAAIGCFSIWLGLLHAISSSRTLTVQVEVTPTAYGTTVMTDGSCSGQSALRYMAERLRELPKV